MDGPFKLDLSERSWEWLRKTRRSDSLTYGDIAMVSGGPGNRRSSAIALVECLVRVSPALARLIRKSARSEADGASARDALLTAAGVQPGESATLRKEVEQVSIEAERWREKATQWHVQLERSEGIVAQRTEEIAVLRGEVHETAEALRVARQRVGELEDRTADLETRLKNRDEQLAHALSLCGLDDDAVALVTSLRDRLAEGDDRNTGDAAAEGDAMIVDRDHIRASAAVEAIVRRDWRLRIVRRLLHVKKS